MHLRKVGIKEGSPGIVASEKRRTLKKDTNVKCEFTVYLEVHVSSVLPDPDVDLVAGASTLAQAPLGAAGHAARLHTTDCPVTRHVIC